MFKSLMRFLSFIPQEKPIDSSEVDNVETEESMSTKVLNKILSDLVRFPPKEWELEPSRGLYCDNRYKHPCLTYTLSYNISLSAVFVILDNGESCSLNYKDNRTLYRVFISEGMYEIARKEASIKRMENAVKFLDDDNRITCKENNTNTDPLNFT
jgi:hypothetical protein